MPNHNNERGMTLLEIMIVLAILGGLMAVLVPNLADSFTRARVKQSGIQLNTIKGALSTYALDCGNLPSTEAGLNALAEDPGETACRNWGPRPYLEKKQLTDQFGHGFRYENESGTAVITFLGKDGREGGQKYDADVTVEVDGG